MTLVKELELQETPVRKPGERVKKARPQPKASKQARAKAREQYWKAKAGHKFVIKQLKKDIKKAKRDIKKHKLLVKQAKLTYKLSK